MNFKKKIKTFLDKKETGKKKLIIIYGPTASGKTGLSIEVAKSIHSEIISTDSRQIFKYLDIGTGKVTKEEMRVEIKADLTLNPSPFEGEGKATEKLKGNKDLEHFHQSNTMLIPHYMLDFLEPDKEYSVGEFKKEAEKYLEEIFEKGKIPILCGGTGLYIDSLIYDFKIPKVPGDKNLREKLEKERLKKGNEYIWKKLNKIDPKYALELHPNNYRYVIRGIEVKTLTGKSKKDFREEKKLKYDVLFLTLYDGDREKLYDRINARVQKMFDDGLVKEVENLLKKYNKNDFGMKTIGYNEVVEYLDGKMSLEECVELVKKHNRNYAKRQLTRFRRYEGDKN